MIDSLLPLRDRALEEKIEKLEERIPTASLGEELEQIEMTLSLRADVDNLKEQAQKISELQHHIHVSVDNLPVLGETVTSLDARVLKH